MNAVNVFGANLAHAANKTTLSQEGSSNGAYWQSYGANSSTVGLFTLRQYSSDGSVSITPLSIASTGAATFTGSVSTGRLNPYAADASPSLTANVGMAVFESSSSVQLQMGGIAASPYTFWMQTKQSNNSGASFPLALNPIGGNVLIGTTTDDTYNKLQVNGSTQSKFTSSYNTTNGVSQQAIYANSNSQGQCCWFTYARTITATGTGTKLNIPFYNQGNLNTVTVARVTICSADFNSAYGNSAQFMFSVGSLTALSNLTILSSGGSFVSATTSGMNVVATLGGNSAIYLVIEYLTSYQYYSIDLGNITLTS
jgi:hypothetical protein